MKKHSPLQAMTEATTEMTMAGKRALTTTAVVLSGLAEILLSVRR